MHPFELRRSTTRNRHEFYDVHDQFLPLPPQCDKTGVALVRVMPWPTLHCFCFLDYTTYMDCQASRDFAFMTSHCSHYGFLRLLLSSTQSPSPVMSSPSDPMYRIRLHTPLPCPSGLNANSFHLKSSNHLLKHDRYRQAVILQTAPRS